MGSRRLAELLLRKAAQDEYAIHKLIDDPDAPDEIIGFHAQQAVEKMLKAILALHGIRYRKTHDLVELLDLMRDNSIPFSEHLENVRRLTPYATVFRYDEYLLDAGTSLDRNALLHHLKEIRQWAETQLQ